MMGSYVEVQEVPEVQDTVYSQEADSPEGVDEVVLVDILGDLEGGRKVVLDDIPVEDLAEGRAGDPEAVPDNHTAAEAVEGNGTVGMAAGDLVGGVEDREACSGQAGQAHQADQVHQEVDHNTVAAQKVADHRIGGVLVGQEVDRSSHTLVDEVGSSAHVLDGRRNGGFAGAGEDNYEAHQTETVDLVAWGGTD